MHSCIADTAGAGEHVRGAGAAAAAACPTARAPAAVRSHGCGAPACPLPPFMSPHDPLWHEQCMSSSARRCMKIVMSVRTAAPRDPHAAWRQECPQALLARVAQGLCRRDALTRRALTMWQGCPQSTGTQRPARPMPRWRRMHRSRARRIGRTPPGGCIRSGVLTATRLQVCTFCAS